MPSKKKRQTRERRELTRAAIDRLLEQRQQVLVHYERVTGVQPFDDGPPSSDLLQRFFQLLMDYIASGHFGLYQRITEGTERRKDVQKVAEDIYPKLAATTERALDFNDAYDKADKSAPIEMLVGELSKLGEVLANRIELEDELIAVMMASSESD